MSAENRQKIGSSRKSVGTKDKTIGLRVFFKNQRGYGMNGTLGVPGSRKQTLSARASLRWNYEGALCSALEVRKERRAFHAIMAK